mmetsp:Transcript_11791/g.21997  ORF Transcript_11791/g.21997 Transcript_11791/m.21997 type:complete len:565 (-) Transcript_11791:20-1714(-)
MPFIANSILGQDSDDLLAYQTSKQAVIRDRYLGCAYYSLVLLALLWVIFGQVMWRNEHFQLKDVKGIPRMWISHPTRNLCDSNRGDCLSDFTPLSKLPYCKQYEGPDQMEHNTNCVFGDTHTLFPEGTLSPNVFIPTAFVEIDEVKDCTPNSTNEFSCNNEYRKKEGQFRDGDDPLAFADWNFYANIEDYRITFTSTYAREGIEGTSLEHPGFYYECFDEDKNLGKKRTWEERLEIKAKCRDERRVELKCLPGADCGKRGLLTIEEVNKDVQRKVKKQGDKIKKHGEEIEETLKDGDLDMDLDNEIAGLQLNGVGTSGRSRRALRHRRPRKKEPRRADAEESKEWNVWSTAYGDVITLGKLLQLAGVDLDRDFSVDEIPTRYSGTIIEVQVIYSNLQQFLSTFGMSQVQYTYRVSERKLPYVSKESLAPGQPKDYPQSRRYLMQAGILLNFEVTGEFGIFNIVHLVIMLTTALALVGTAKQMTDLFAIYLHPLQNNYFHMKYDVSPDFSEMWQCPKCEYLNVSSCNSCQGIPKYHSRFETPMCGERKSPRPRRASQYGGSMFSG